MSGTTIFSDFLNRLGVAHTAYYSDSRFHDMPFKTLFGFVRLLSDYGVSSEAYTLSDKSQMQFIPTPFIARQNSNFVIVDGFSCNESGDKFVHYTLYHRSYVRSLADFESASDGVVLLAYPDAGSEEPDIASHRWSIIVNMGKRILMLLCVLMLLAFGMISSEIYRDVPMILLFCVNLVGMGVTWMLLQKSLHIGNHTADKVCGILQKHGCDTVLEQKASTFYGIFSWSEVGISYFSMSMIILLLFPELQPYLALINACCLPFTVWSICYQKFKIKTWCTLCVITQVLLWCQFACYLAGGCWHDLWPLRIPFFIMIAAYVALLLSVNAVMVFIKRFSGLSSVSGNSQK